jgi:hypothetical protein
MNEDDFVHRRIRMVGIEMGDLDPRKMWPEKDVVCRKNELFVSAFKLLLQKRKRGVMCDDN